MISTHPDIELIIAAYGESVQVHARFLDHVQKYSTQSYFLCGSYVLAVKLVCHWCLNA